MSVDFTEKYRPNKLSECVLPNRIKSKLEKLIKRKDIGHLIFYGSAGIGKTATAQALIKELSPDDSYEVNASQDNSVDFIEKNIVRGMTTISLYGNKRIILLDEADGLTEKAQKLLRVPMEKYSKNNSLILCFNDASKIIEPIKSRCLEFDFNIRPKEEEEIGKGLLKRFSQICKKEGIKLTRKGIQEIIEDNWFDVRKMLKSIEMEA